MASHNENNILVYESSMISKISNKTFCCHDKRINGIRASVRFIFERLKETKGYLFIFAIRELHLYYKVILI